MVKCDMLIQQSVWEDEYVWLFIFFHHTQEDMVDCQLQKEFLERNGGPGAPHAVF